MKSKLYSVSLSVDLLIVAPDEAAASSVARRHFKGHGRLVISHPNQLSSSASCEKLAIDIDTMPDFSTFANEEVKKVSEYLTD